MMDGWEAVFRTATLGHQQVVSCVDSVSGVDSNEATN